MMDALPTVLSGVGAALLLIALVPFGCDGSTRPSDDGWTYLHVEGCDLEASVDGERWAEGMPHPIRAGTHTVACGMDDQIYESHDVFVEEGTVRYFNGWGP